MDVELVIFQKSVIDNAFSTLPENTLVIETYKLARVSFEMRDFIIELAKSGNAAAEAKLRELGIDYIVG